MIRTVHLHGALGADFGYHHRLAIDSPAEGVRALCAQIRGFRTRIEAMELRVFRGALAEDRALDPVELHVPFGAADGDLHIVPLAEGAKRDGLGKVLLGGLLIAASFVVPGSWAIAGRAVSGILGQAGVAMALGGIAQMMSPQVTSEYDSREQPKSDLFNGPVNTSTPGQAIPVILGECEAGSVVASAAIHVEDRA